MFKIVLTKVKTINTSKRNPSNHILFVSCKKLLTKYKTI